MKQIKRAIPIVLALVMAFALSVTAWADVTAGYYYSPNTTDPFAWVVATEDSGSGTYETMDDAVNAAKTGKFGITAITVNSGTYDLSADTNAPITVKGGKLTIEGGTHSALIVEGGEATIEADATVASVTVKDGKLTIKGGTHSALIVEDGEATIAADATVASITVKGGKLTTSIGTAVAATGGTVYSAQSNIDLTVSGSGSVNAYGKFKGVTVESGVLNLGATENSGNATTTVSGGLTVNGGTAYVGGGESAEVTITNDAFPLVTVYNSGNLTVNDKTTIKKTFATAADPVAVYVGLSGASENSSAAHFNMNGGSIELDGDNENNTNPVRAIYNGQFATTVFTKGTIKMVDIPDTSAGIYNYGKLTVGEKDDNKDDAKIEMDCGKAISSLYSDAVTKIYDLNVRIKNIAGTEGNTYGIYADRSKLFIESGPATVSTAATPTATVNVSVDYGTALYVAEQTDWHIYGGYQTAVFRGTTGLNVNTNIADYHRNLTAGRFIATGTTGNAIVVSAANEDEYVNKLLPAYNYYLRTDTGTDAAKDEFSTNADDVTVVDAVWELQYVMENAEPYTKSNGAYTTGTTPSYKMGVSVDLGAYTDANKDGYVFYDTHTATPHGTLAAPTTVEDFFNQQVKVAYARTLDLNGKTITGNGKNDVIAVSSGGDLTVQDSATGGEITNAGPLTISVMDGKLTLQSGTISNTYGSTGGTAITATSATVDVTGGTINAAGEGIKAANSATVNVSGGTINATGESGKGIVAGATTSNVTIGTYGQADDEVAAPVINATTGKGVHVNGGTVKIYDATITATGNNGTGIDATDGCLYIVTGKHTVDDVFAGSYPQRVTVTATSGTALNIGENVDGWGIAGGYKTAKFEGTTAAKISASNIGTQLTTNETNGLTNGWFVSTAVDDNTTTLAESFTTYIPNTNYYAKTANNNGGDFDKPAAKEIVITDAEWELRTVFGTATDVNGFTATRKYELPVSIKLGNSTEEFAAIHGSVAGHATPASITIADDVAATLDLNGKSITGASGVDVFVGKPASLAIVNEGAAASEITATGATASAINLTGGNVSVEANKANITITGINYGIKTNGTVTVNNTSTNKAVTIASAVDSYAISADAAVTITNDNGGSISTYAIKSDTAVTITNGENAEDHGFIEVKGTISSAALTLTNNATPENVDDTTGGKITVTAAITATGAVTIENLSSGLIDAKTIGAGTNDVSIYNVAADAETANNGRIKTTAITGKNVKVTNNSTYATSGDTYAVEADTITATGTVEITNNKTGEIKTAAITATGNVTIDNVRADATNVTGKVKTGTIAGKDVTITSNAYQVADDTTYAVEADAITANNNATIYNWNNGNIKTDTITANNGDITIGNFGDKDVVTDDLSAQKDVSIVNLGNGTVGNTEAAANITATAGNVGIWNASLTVNPNPVISENDDIDAILNQLLLPAANEGKIVFGAITAKGEVKIDSYSADAEAVKTGKITANTNAVTINNNGTGGIGVYATGSDTVAITATASNVYVTSNDTNLIVIKSSNGDAIKAGGYVNVHKNYADGEIQIKSTSAYAVSADSNVTIINAYVVGADATPNGGKVTLTGDVNSADFTIDCYSTASDAAVSVADGEKITATGNVEITNRGDDGVKTGAIDAKTADKSVLIDNKLGGTITTGNIDAQSGSSYNNVTIYNVGADAAIGRVKTGAITGKDVKVTNNSTYATFADTTYAVQADAIVADNAVEITNNAAGEIKLDTITAYGAAGDAVVVKISSTKGNITTGNITTDGVESTDSAGKVEINNADNGIITTGDISAMKKDDGTDGDVGIYNVTADANSTTARIKTGKITGKAVSIKNNSAYETTDDATYAVQADAIDATGNTLIDNQSTTGKIAIIGTTEHGVKVTGANLTITAAADAPEDTIIVTGTNGNGAYFVSNDAEILTIKAGKFTGKEAGHYGLYVGPGTGNIDLVGKATYNSVTTERASVYGTFVVSGTADTVTYTKVLLDKDHDWALADGTLLPRNTTNYGPIGTENKILTTTTNYYKVVPVTHSLTANSPITANTSATISTTVKANNNAFDNAALKFDSADTTKATVNGSGVVTKVADGTTTVTVGDAYGDKATVTVNPPVQNYVGGGGSSAPTPTVSLSGDDNSVSIGVSTKGDTATMSEPKAADLEKVIGAGVDTGEVVIDMSKLSSSIDTATVPTKTFDAIEAAVTDASNDAEEFTIKLPASSVTFDADALDAIAEQAAGSTISLEVSKETVSKLATAQQNAVKALDVQDVYSITLTSGSKTISDFKGGSAAVSVNYTLKAGQSARGIVVWYVANDGTLTEVPSTFSAGKVTFTVSHFSNYVIAYDATRAAACPQDSTCPIAAFSDADATAWYHDGVHWALENGVMSGMGNGTFAPNGTTTRAMVAQILWNLEGKPAYVGMSEYADVDNEDWFGPAVRWASAEGIVTGYQNPDDTGMIFKPNDAVTREQLATMLYRYAQYKGIDVSVGEDTNILSYEDALGVSTWAMAAMQWACGAGVVNGVAANGTMYLQPQNNASRAVVATMIARFCTEVAK